MDGAGRCDDKKARPPAAQVPDAETPKRLNANSKVFDPLCNLTEGSLFDEAFPLSYCRGPASGLAGDHAFQPMLGCNLNWHHSRSSLLLSHEVQKHAGDLGVPKQRLAPELASKIATVRRHENMSAACCRPFSSGHPNQVTCNYIIISIRHVIPTKRNMQCHSLKLCRNSHLARPLAPLCGTAGGWCFPWPSTTCAIRQPYLFHKSPSMF